MPFQVRPVTDERDGLKAYVAQQQDAFRAVAYGLSDADAGLRPTPSSLSVGALVKHVTQVQQNWLTGVRAAPDLPVDGATTFELIAGYEGAAATAWLTPWAPPS